MMRPMTRPILPLSRFPLIRTASVEEALHLQSRINSPAVGEHLERRLPFRWTANATSFDALHIVASRYAGAARAGTRNVDGQYSLLVPRHAGVLAEQGRDEAAAHRGRLAALVSPSMPAAFQVNTRYEGLQVSVPARLIDDALAALAEPGAAIHSSPLRFELAVDTTGGAGAEVVRMLEYIVGSIDRDSEVIDSAILRGRLTEAFVYTLLLGLPHSRSRLVHRPTRPTEPSYVERAAEYIAANAHGPVTIADLVTVTGVSARALFAGFRAHRGRSPMTFLRDRRFELARRHLLTSAAASTTVAEVALACGFEHLGRFSVTYRARFGESPAETLRRRSRR